MRTAIILFDLIGHRAIDRSQQVDTTVKQVPRRVFFHAGIELYNPAARRAAPFVICGRTALATRAGVCPASQVRRRPQTI
jgi:hypothetical protein